MKYTSLAAIVAVFGLSGCEKAKTLDPGAVCAAPATYDTLSGMIANARDKVFSEYHLDMAELDSQKIAAAKSASAVGNLRSAIKFSMPTVEQSEISTGKIGCEVTISVPFPKAAQSWTNLNELPFVTDVAPDKVSMRVAYKVQPSADGSGNVVTLDSGAAIARVAVLGAAAGTLSPEDLNRGIGGEYGPMLAFKAADPPPEIAPKVEGSANDDKSSSPAAQPNAQVAVRTSVQPAAEPPPFDDPEPETPQRPYTGGYYDGSTVHQ